MSKFFNPGFAWKYTLKFDNPTTDASSSNVSYYNLEAPENSFFEVKDTQTISLPTGEEYEIPLRFKELVRTQYAECGVVLVAPGRECREEENIAPNEEEAKHKAKALWRIFLNDKCNEWFRIVEETRANGRLPMPAQGLFKRCLAEMGIADPADQASNLAAAREGQQDNKDLQKQIQQLTAQVNQLIGAKNAKGA